MGKLNNKGMTAVELLITFTILSVVVVGLFDMTLNYKDKEQQESTKSSIIDYENKLEKLIQDDFIKGHLVSVSIDDTASTNVKKATFKMNKPEYRKNDIENYNESLEFYTTTLSIDFDRNVVSYGITGKEISYPLPQFGAGNKVTINKDKTIIDVYDMDNSFVNIDIAFSYIDIDDDDILFSMSSPIDYPLNLDNRNILTGTVTINDTNSWNVIVTDTRPYAIGSNDEYVKIKIKNTSDVNLYYSFYYMGANTLNIPENGKQPGYINEERTALDFENGVLITAGAEISFYLNICALKDRSITLGLTISPAPITNSNTDIRFFERIHNLAGVVKLKAYLSNSLNKDETTTFLAGNIKNNYVWYSGHLWRAVAIDNSTDNLKLITDQAETFISYGLGNSQSGVPASNSNISIFLRKFFGEIRNTNGYTSASVYNYSSYDPNTGSLTNTTSNSLVSSNIGLLNAYEYLMTLKDNKSYLVKDSLFWFTLTPLAGSYNNIFLVDKTGSLSVANVSHTFSGVRPVITLKNTVVIREGDGTKSQPYIIERNMGAHVQTLVSGDYIDIRNSQGSSHFRVVSNKNNRLKVISMDRSKRGFEHNLSSDSALYRYLNTEFLNNCSNDIKSAIVTSSWDITPMDEHEYTQIDSNSKTMRAKVGLLKVGDLLSGYCKTSQGCMLLTQTRPTGNYRNVYIVYSYTDRMGTTSTSSTAYHAVPVINLRTDSFQVVKFTPGTSNDPIILKIN